MSSITLRSVDIERDFGEIDRLFSEEQDEPSSVPALKLDYEAHKERILRLMVAEDGEGNWMGFNWVTRSRFDPLEAYLFVIVRKDRRSIGAGARLYADLEQAVRAAGVKRLTVHVRDDCPECRAFAERRGFVERRHTFRQSLDLTTLDPRPYEPVIARLKAEGFRFTSMEELGDTEEARRRLYALNDISGMDVMGGDGSHSWPSFEDFQRTVCQTDWYKPAGQMVVIDTHNDAWAAMSAITRMANADYAFNLYTGVDSSYRRRGLGRAVKTLALLYARDVLQTATCRTENNALNLPMLAINRRMGYTRLPGTFTMAKTLD